MDCTKGPRSVGCCLNSHGVWKCPSNDGSEEHLRIIRDLDARRKDLKLDFWKEAKGLNRPVEVLVPPTTHGFQLAQYLNATGLPADTVIENLQSLIDKHKLKTENDQKAEISGREYVYGDDVHLFRLDIYHSYEEMQSYMRTLEVMFPDLITLERIGESFEGRDLFVAKLGAPKSDAQNVTKPVFWIDAGIHAREWIGPATALYIMHQLILQYKDNANIRKLMQTFDWYILPSVNPDGYEFSRTEDRMWRKTRSATSECLLNRTNENCCFGCDPNRNWGYKWAGPGTSDDPCSDLFYGTAAFSEPETNATANFIMKHQGAIKAFITLHSYAQMWLLPYGYEEPPVYPSDFAEMMRVAEIGVAALKSVHGTVFQVGNSVDLLYPAAGASDDWAKAVAKIKYVYTLELRPTLTNDEDGSGFMIPSTQILPTAEETFEAIKAVAMAI